jgi:uncharacterized protein
VRSKFTLVLMLKAPRPGTVKTRLAAALGPARATAIYRTLVERQLASIPPGLRAEIHYAPGEDPAAGAELSAWLGPGTAYFPQSSGDLGDRLSAAFAAAFDRGAAGVLAIGGDCPGLDSSVLASAAASLAAHELVLGPATDGGYYLIGLARPRPELFADMPWSTGRLLEATLARAASLGLAPKLLPPLDDIDTAEDLARHPGLG